MLALTLTQPWASLVAIGAKSIETRSWTTSYRGPLAIHAAKGYPGWAREFAAELALDRDSYDVDLSRLAVDALPLGAVLAVCRLVDVRPITKTTWASLLAEGRGDELEFGDFTPGRYAWFLADVRPLPAPIPARGRLGLWEWESAATDLPRRVAGQLAMELA